MCQQQKEQSITTSTKNINEDGAKKSAAEEKSCEKLVNLKKRKSLNENQCESNKNRKISSRKKSLHNSNNNQQKSKVENRITTKSIVLPSTISIIQPQIITFELPEAASLPSKPILLPKTVELTTTVLNNHHLSSIHLQQSQSISVKEKLRDTINNHQNSTSPNIYKKTTLLSENKYFPRKNNNKKIINSIENTNINDESNNAQNDCDDLLERRRAAAMRYRRKIKKEQEELRQKNADLMTENIKLKATIRQLKQILANHQNCSNVQSSCAIGRRLLIK